MSIFLNPINRMFGWVSGKTVAIIRCLKPKDKKVNNLAPQPVNDQKIPVQPIKASFLSRVLRSAASKVSGAINWFLPANFCEAAPAKQQFHAQKTVRNDRFIERYKKKLFVEKRVRVKEELKEAVEELKNACDEKDRLHKQLSWHREMLKIILNERDALLIALDDFPKYTRNLQDENDTKAQIAKLNATLAIVEERKIGAEERVAAAKARLASMALEQHPLQKKLIIPA